MQYLVGNILCCRDNCTCVYLVSDQVFYKTPTECFYSFLLATATDNCYLQKPFSIVKLMKLPVHLQNNLL